MELIVSNVIGCDNEDKILMSLNNDNAIARKRACSELNMKKNKFGRGAAGCVIGEFVLDRNKIKAGLADLFALDKNRIVNLENIGNKPTIEDLIFLQPDLRQRTCMRSLCAY